MKKILLIIARENFQPVEYYNTKAVLEEFGHQVVTASDGEGEAKAAHDSIPAKIDVPLSLVNVRDYDAVLLIGGSGAMDHLDNEIIYNLMTEAVSTDKIIGAICIASRILAKADLLNGKKATGWDGDKRLGQILTDARAEYIAQPVVVDQKLATASGPDSSKEWARAVVDLLK